MEALARLVGEVALGTLVIDLLGLCTLVIDWSATEDDLWLLDRHLVELLSDRLTSPPLEVVGDISTLFQRLLTGEVGVHEWGRPGRQHGLPRVLCHSCLALQGLFGGSGDTETGSHVRGRGAPRATLAFHVRYCVVDE